MASGEDDYNKYFHEYFEWIKNEFKKIDNSRKRYIFALYNSEIIGFIRIWYSEYCNRCFNDGIDVKKEYQNKGIGYRLLINGIIEAKNLNAKEIVAHINKNNIPSVKIHEKTGFIKMGIASINSYGEELNNENIFEYVYKLG
jgi:RimJ/RimL family protein N-acetyltransferase